MGFGRFAATIAPSTSAAALIADRPDQRAGMPDRREVSRTATLFAELEAP